jgi:hypothetical protein
VPTRYEVELYRDVERIRKAAERRTDIEACRYLRERLREGGFAPGEKGWLEEQLKAADARAIGTPK